MATLNTTSIATILPPTSKLDQDKHRSRQIYATTMAKARRKNQHVHNAEQRTMLAPDTDLVVMPKYRRDQEDYVNPHLKPEEQPALPPRWVGDAVPRHSRPVNARCRCSWCTGKPSQRLDDGRTLQEGLKNVAGRGYFKQGRCPDWDWNGRDDPFAYDGDSDWMRHFEEDKPASSTVQVDLLAIAKPAKAKRRPAKGPTSLATRKLSVVHSELDGASFIDYEEAWDWLDDGNIDTSSRFGEDERRSEWEWDRCSEV
ncbi:hypothetical protein FRC17_006094 [Serendipita sp. 399]|nr:hypothetical protein FRC17_006094 [Serendipita sp. 399]